MCFVGVHAVVGAPGEHVRGVYATDANNLFMKSTFSSGHSYIIPYNLKRN